MLAKQEPQLEWRFWDEEGADEAAWQATRLISAGSDYATSQPFGRSKQPWYRRRWLDLILLAALTAALLYVRLWQSPGVTSVVVLVGSSDERGIGERKDIQQLLARSKPSGRDQMNPVEQHCSQLPPDAAPIACPLFMHTDAKAARSHQMDAIEQHCSQLPPDAVPISCGVP